MNSLKRFSDRLDQTLSNGYVLAFVMLFVILYGSLARPQLPDGIMNLFDNWLFRLLILTLIAFIALRNFAMALLVAILFTLLMNAVSEQRMTMSYMNGA